MENITKVFGQSRPRGDIAILAYILILVCLVQFAAGVVLIFFAIFLPNNERVIFHILQWTFACLAVTFPWFGMLGAWKTLLSSLTCFGIYCVAQFVWNILYIIGLAIVAPLYKLIPEIILAGIELFLAVVLFILTAVMSALIMNYYRMQE